MEPEAYAELAQLEATHWWYSGMRRITAALIERHIFSGTPLTILDAGCGAGGNLAALAHYGTTAGFDFSPLALAYARREHANPLACASVEHLPYRAATVDLLTSFDVICSIGVPDDVQSLREFARVLRPGGKLILRLPALPVLRGHHDLTVHIARRYTRADLRRKLEAAGLQVDRLTYANSILLPLIFAIRRAQLLFLKPRPGQPSDVQPTPGPLNAVLDAILALEARLVAAGIDLPAGVSLFAIATRPVSAAP